MLTIFKTINNEIVQIHEYEQGTWINLINPTEEEISGVASATGIYCEFLKYPLDEEEKPHLEVEESQKLIIISVPVIEPKPVMYYTIPLGIIITDGYIVTTCLENVSIISEFCEGKMKDLATFKKTRFVFQILYKNASLYLKYLREINKKTNEIEFKLHKSMKNRELIKLLNLEKSLVYFSTSLRSNEVVMEKLLRTKAIKMYEEDQDLLEDVLIENRQAIEMADIYSSVLSGMMDAFANIISNNLNIVMKFLASITIVLAIPTMIASFWGMNVPVPFQGSSYGFIFAIGLSSLLSALGVMYLAKKGMF